ncbi:hypothetical protein GCM10023171_03390 [Microbacterium panaciterrae]|uniref:Uncharacterized protein n=1 Tax=Microbacterium panaciterrae TaxID=985759 RepID=A0ABP8P0T3_9MICO
MQSFGSAADATVGVGVGVDVEDGRGEALSDAAEPPGDGGSDDAGPVSGAHAVSAPARVRPARATATLRVFMPPG